MVLKYAKVVDTAKACIVGLGNDEAFYEALGFERCNVEQAWDGSWYLVGHVPQKPVTAAEDVRAERDRRLSASDWTQMADTPLPAEECLLWRQYRQALRDLPRQAGFPESVVWPEKPSESVSG